MAEKNDKGSEQERHAAMARAQRALQNLPAKKRMDAIIDSNESAALVRAMPVQDLYALIADVGLSDATELVQMASPAQFQGFLDLSVWRKDRIDARGVLIWLRAARGDDEKGYLAKLRKMDLEILELVLREYVRVYDLENNPDVALTGMTLETPEGKYLLDLMGEGLELATVRQLVTDLIAENPFEATRLFEATRWEVPSELEHAANQFRQARLEDLGFPTLDGARSLFAYTKPPPVQVSAAAPDSRSLAPLHRIDFFAAASAVLTENELENVGDELRSLANIALVAEAGDPGDLDVARQVGELVRDTLSLGIEYLSGGDPGLAGDVVRDHELRRVFQVGFSLTLQLKFRADRLGKKPLARRDGTYLLFDEERAAVAALRAVRPRRALRVEGAEPVPFRSRAELLESEALLGRAEAQNSILVALLGSDPEAAFAALSLTEASVDAEAILAAAVAHALLDGEIRILSVAAKRVAALGERWVEAAGQDVRVLPSAREKAKAVLGAVVPAEAHGELSRLIDAFLDRGARELGRSLLSGPDAQTVSALVPVAIQ